MPAKVGIKSCRCASEHARRCVYCVCSYVAAYVGVHRIIIDDSIARAYSYMHPFKCIRTDYGYLIVAK